MQRQVLQPDGKLVAGAQPMEEEFLLEALRWMMKSRLYDHRVIGMQRQGLFGVYSPGMGQEASIVGSAMAVDPARDWMVPQYRELMASVHHGLPLEVISSQYLGKIGPARIPEGVKVLPTQVAIAAQLPQATGLAWGLKLRGEDSVVIAYIGDGGSSEGDFHEGLNLAGVTKAPIVFFLSNNQWAISTSRRVQTATRSFALRAAGYGFDGVEVDGNDVMAVYAATRAAVDKARKGGGPGPAAARGASALRARRRPEGLNACRSATLSRPSTARSLTRCRPTSASWCWDWTSASWAASSEPPAA